MECSGLDARALRWEERQGRGGELQQERRGSERGREEEERRPNKPSCPLPLCVLVCASLALLRVRGKGGAHCWTTTRTLTGLRSVPQDRGGSPIAVAICDLTPKYHPQPAQAADARMHRCRLVCCLSFYHGACQLRIQLKDFCPGLQLPLSLFSLQQDEPSCVRRRCCGHCAVAPPPLSPHKVAQCAVRIAQEKERKRARARAKKHAQHALPLPLVSRLTASPARCPSFSSVWPPAGSRSLATGSASRCARPKCSTGCDTLSERRNEEGSRSGSPKSCRRPCAALFLPLVLTRPHYPAGFRCRGGILSLSLSLSPLSLCLTVNTTRCLRGDSNTDAFLNLLNPISARPSLLMLLRRCQVAPACTFVLCALFAKSRAKARQVSLPALLPYRRRQFLDSAKASAFKTFQLHLPGNGWLVGILEPDNVQHVLEKNFDNYVKVRPSARQRWTPALLHRTSSSRRHNGTHPKGDFIHQILIELLGQGIFNVDGAEWSYQRKAASHMFRRSGLRGLMTECVSPRKPGGRRPLRKVLARLLGIGKPRCTESCARVILSRNTQCVYPGLRHCHGLHRQQGGPL